MTDKALKSSDPAALAKATTVLNQGGVIVAPTDTVYGLMCKDDSQASAKLNRLKKRPLDQPIALIVSSLSDCSPYFPDEWQAKLPNYFPGPYTLISPWGEALRVPDHQWICQLAETVGPLRATSVNMTGEATITELSQLETNPLRQSIDLQIDDGVCPGPASQIIDCAKERVIRE